MWMEFDPNYDEKESGESRYKFFEAYKQKAHNDFINFLNYLENEIKREDHIIKDIINWFFEIYDDQYGNLVKD